MTNKPAITMPQTFQARKAAYIDSLHAELGLNRRFQIRFFVTEVLVHATAFEASAPKLRSRAHVRKYFEQNLATLEARLGADHWKVSCYQALRRDYLSGALDWAIYEYLKMPVR
jgi:hypothetical protein